MLLLLFCLYPCFSLPSNIYIASKKIFFLCHNDWCSNTTPPWSLCDFIVIFVCCLAQIQSTQISINKSNHIFSFAFSSRRFRSLYFKYNPNNIYTCTTNGKANAKQSSFSKQITNIFHAKWNFTNIFNLNCIPNFMLSGVCGCEFVWVVCLFTSSCCRSISNIHTFTITRHPSPTISVSHSMLCLCIFLLPVHTTANYPHLRFSTAFIWAYSEAFHIFRPVTNAEDGLFTTNQRVFVFEFVCFCRMQIMHSCVFAGEPISMAANQFKKKKKEGKLFKKNDRNK